MRRRSTPPSPSSRSDIDGSGAKTAASHPEGPVRQRAISAALFVPILLIVLAIAGPVLAIFITVIAGPGGDGGLPTAAVGGLRTFAALGTALTVVIVLDAAFPQVLDGSGTLLVACGRRAGRVGVVHQDRATGRAECLGRRPSSARSTPPCSDSSSGSAMRRRRSTAHPSASSGRSVAGSSC